MKETPRRHWLLPLVGGLAVASVLVMVLAIGRVGSALSRVVGPGTTRVDQAVVVEKMRAVARLVTSETTLRDVVVYENRHLGSTKRSIVVVTGRVLTGFDLDRGTEVHVDHEARRIRVELPPAAVEDARDALALARDETQPPCRNVRDFKKVAARRPAP